MNNDYLYSFSYNTQSCQDLLRLLNIINTANMVTESDPFEEPTELIDDNNDVDLSDCEIVLLSQKDDDSCDI